LGELFKAGLRLGRALGSLSRKLNVLLSAALLSAALTSTALTYFQEKTGVSAEGKFKVNTFINLDIEELSSDIKEIVDIAQEEAKIEDSLTVIRKRWEDRKFVLTREQVGPNSPKLTIINQVKLARRPVIE